MELQTARLLLRPLTVADCTPEYVGWLGDRAVNQFLETRHTSHDHATVTGFVEAMANRSDVWLFGIFLSQDRRHVGNIKVGPVHPHHSLADISLLLGARDVWGTGIATEAILVVSRFAIGQLGVRKLSASMYAQNAASARAFEKAGYRREGLRRDHYDLDGERADLIELGLVPGDLS